MSRAERAALVPHAVLADAFWLAVDVALTFGFTPSGADRPRVPTRAGSASTWPRARCAAGREADPVSRRPCHVIVYRPPPQHDAEELLVAPEARLLATPIPAAPSGQFAHPDSRRIMAARQHLRAAYRAVEEIGVCPELHREVERSIGISVKILDGFALSVRAALEHSARSAPTPGAAAGPTLQPRRALRRSERPCPRRP